MRMSGRTIATIALLDNATNNRSFLAAVWSINDYRHTHAHDGPSERELIVTITAAFSVRLLLIIPGTRYFCFVLGPHTTSTREHTSTRGNPNTQAQQHTYSVPPTSSRRILLQQAATDVRSTNTPRRLYLLLLAVDVDLCFSNYFCLLFYSVHTIRSSNWWVFGGGPQYLK